MISEVSAEMREMLARASKLGSMERLAGFLRGELEKSRAQNDLLEGAPLTRSQGKCVFIQELLDIMDGRDGASGKLPEISPEP